MHNTGTVHVSQAIYTQCSSPVDTSHTVYMDEAQEVSKLNLLQFLGICTYPQTIQEERNVRILVM